MWQCTPAFSALTALRSPYSSPACSSASVSSTMNELPTSASTPHDTKQPNCTAHKCRCNRQSATPGACLHCKTAHSICTKLEGPQVHHGAAKVARTNFQDMRYSGFMPRVSARDEAHHALLQALRAFVDDLRLSLPLALAGCARGRPW